MKAHAILLTLGISVLGTGCVSAKRWCLRSADKRIIAEVESLILERLENPSADSDITFRYGKFLNMISSSWNRYDKPFRPIIFEHLTWHGTAHFEKADVNVIVEIDHGEAVSLQQFGIQPSRQWRLENGAELIQGENSVGVTAGPPGETTRGIWSGIEGRAKHPDFLVESLWYKGL